MTRRTFYILASVCTVVGIVGGLFAAPYLSRPSGDQGMISAHWAHPYPSLGAMTRDADAVVLATVEETRPGRTVLTSGGQNILPFTLVDLAVERVIHGSADEVITVEQTGGLVDETIYYIDDDGGSYDVGQRVLLFLKQQPDTGYYYLTHPQGRFRVWGDELQAVASDGPAAQALDRRSVQGAIHSIQSTH